MNNEVPNYPQGRLVYTVTEYDPDTSQLLWRYDSDTWNEAVHWCITEDLTKWQNNTFSIMISFVYNTQVGENNDN